MKIIILGKGYVGTYLYANLAYDAAFDVRIYSRQELDYTDTSILNDMFEQHAPDVIVNACGYTGRPNVDACEADKHNCWYYNVTVPCNIERLCYKHDCNMIHISSGCIYTGYDKLWTENDTPNFGLYDYSSWYSKTKHACEMQLNKDITTILRIRMPFSACKSDRNFISKMVKYDKLVSYLNSMTCVEDLCNTVNMILTKKIMFSTEPIGILNVTHEQPVSARDITKLLSHAGMTDKQFEFVKTDDLDMTAPRSNCIMSTEKLKSYDLQLPDVYESLDRCISKLVE